MPLGPQTRAATEPTRKARFLAWLGGPLLLLGTLGFCLLSLELSLRVARWWEQWHARPGEQVGAVKLVEDNEWVFYQYDSLLGWKNLPGAEGFFTIPDSRTWIKINSLGLRDGEHGYEKRDQPRILVLGDSFTWGFGVEQRDRFTDRLQSALGEGIEVINAGVTGYGTDQELLYLEHEGIRYQPDIVLLCFGLEDFINNTNSIQYSYPKPYFVLGDGELRLQNDPVPERTIGWAERFELPPDVQSHPLGLLAKLKRLLDDDLGDHLLSYGFLIERLRKAEPVVRGYFQKTPIEPVTAALLLRMKAFVQSHGARLVVMMVPYRDHFGTSGPPEKWKAVRTFLESQGFLWMDPRSDFLSAMENGEQPFYSVDPHWNPTGHEIVAKALASYLQDRSLVPRGSHPPAP